MTSAALGTSKSSLSPLLIDSTSGSGTTMVAAPGPCQNST
eukprot:CAMPEP_0114690002 /NCGR_PEP_ID=MMETSP0191-20121206/65186_1 /TAXON_ID=126664 /ORGANISM="Sorites sp." /LENGTH=39 /DNA_ID= /DNA_START= /DNA_END= /DNA_ORIENTATION=